MSSVQYTGSINFGKTEPSTNYQHRNKWTRALV